MNTKITNIILLIIRILTGAVLIYASYIKLINMDQTIGTFNQYFGLSETTTWFVTIGEMLTGLGILLGVWTKVAAFGSIIIMGGAVYYAKDVNAVILLVLSILLFITGSGRFAVIPCGPLVNKKCDCDKDCCK